MDESLFYGLAAAAILLLVAFPVHEFSHALAAFRLGDSTARWQGRLTLNPLVHFDTTGGLMTLLTVALSAGQFVFGFAKPTPVNPLNLHGGRRGEALVALAGPLSNLAMAAIIAIPVRIVGLSEDTALSVYGSTPLALLYNIAVTFVSFNLLLLVFNLLPVPPLDGWHVLLGVASPRLAWQLRSFEQRYAALIPIVFLAIILVGGSVVLGPILDFLEGLLMGPTIYFFPVL